MNAFYNISFTVTKFIWKIISIHFSLQIPLILISGCLEKAVGPRAGNVIVWISLIIGQPLAIMMYYHDFVVEHYGEEVISYYGHVQNFDNRSV